MVSPFAVTLGQLFGETDAAGTWYDGVLADWLREIAQDHGGSAGVETGGSVAFSVLCPSAVVQPLLAPPSVMSSHLDAPPL